MTRSIVTERKSLETKSTAIGSKFGKFDLEREVSSTKAEVKETAAIRGIDAAWRACGCDLSWSDNADYFSMLQTVKNLLYTSEDIERFSLALADFQQEKEFPWKAGLFLSALINNGNENDYTIHVHHLGESLHNIGFRNKKNITVNGNAGNDVGEKMKDGSITVMGDVRDRIGYWMKGGSIDVMGNAGSFIGRDMKNGSITIKGNTEGDVGTCMEGGSIAVAGNAGNDVGELMEGGCVTINGNAGIRIGEWMRGGEIRLECDYGIIGDYTGRRIYHNGQLFSGKIEIALSGASEKTGRHDTSEDGGDALVLEPDKRLNLLKRIWIKITRRGKE
jgi:formylmethanofuran dehydrogenase subunit C